MINGCTQAIENWNEILIDKTRQSINENFTLLAYYICYLNFQIYKYTVFI